RGEPNIHKNEDFDITEPQVIEDGEDVAILFHGSIGLEVLKARGLLAGDGVFPRLISVPLVMPVNIEKLLPLLKGVKCVVTVEEHFLNSGFGSALSREYVKMRPDWKLFTLGITDGFIHVIKDSEAMREHFGISASRIAEFIRKMDV
ncbi:MAG: transketolase C-terminal domain-containing protein, partial [Planctomycetota bacterium]